MPPATCRRLRAAECRPRPPARFRPGWHPLGQPRRPPRDGACLGESAAGGASQQTIAASSWSALRHAPRGPTTPTRAWLETGATRCPATAAPGGRRNVERCSRCVSVTDGIVMGGDGRARLTARATALPTCLRCLRRTHASIGRTGCMRSSEASTPVGRVRKESGAPCSRACTGHLHPSNASMRCLHIS